MKKTITTWSETINNWAFDFTQTPDGWWYIISPTGLVCYFDRESVTEHDDQTISINFSVRLGVGYGALKWCGRLEHGEWISEPDPVEPVLLLEREEIFQLAPLLEGPQWQAQCPLNEDRRLRLFEAGILEEYPDSYGQMARYRFTPDGIIVFRDSMDHYRIPHSEASNE